MLGNIDVVDAHSISGWFLDKDEINKIITTEIIINSVPYTIVNNQYREDLYDTFGTKIGGFHFNIPLTIRIKGYYEIIFAEYTFQKIFTYQYCWISLESQIRALTELNQLILVSPKSNNSVQIWLREYVFKELMTSLRQPQALNSFKSLKITFFNCLYWMHIVGRYDKVNNGNYQRVFRKSYARTKKRGFKIMLGKLGEEVQERFAKKMLDHKRDIFFTHPLNHIKSRTIDIIIPCYRGFKETKECIESVLNAYNETNYEIIVVNDFSPEVELTEYLRQKATNEEITLIENSENKGFVKSVNIGMRLHSDRDVILLNSDTIVSNGWIDKLNRAAYLEKNIGTVTPFSNRATICSFPESNIDNEMICGYSVEELSNLFEMTNQKIIVDIPTAVGFCMYIKRDTLNEIGYFDEIKWAMGYCEENDFSMKAETHGWRNVLACDTFVEHRGSVSFAGEKSQRIEENLKKLLLEYPEYNLKIQNFILQDPIALYRKNVILEILKFRNKKYILMITHSLGGGTKVAVEAISKLISDSDTGILILEGGECFWTLKEYGTELKVLYSDKDSANLANDLLKLPILLVHYHQVIYFPWDIWELPSVLNIPYYISIHDYLYICPRLNLIDNHSSYCGEPESSYTCDECVSKNGTYSGLFDKFDDVGHSVEMWRKRFEKYFNMAKMVIAPSIDAKCRMEHYYPGANIVFKAHPEIFDFELREVHSEGINIVVLGAISKIKGFDLLQECIQYADLNKMKIHFHIVGYTADDTAFAQYSNVTIYGTYLREELDDILKLTQANIALFLSCWPETYSYTLSEAWAHGLYPIALDIGAFRGRIEETGVGEIISFPTTAETIVTELVDLSSVLKSKSKDKFSYNTIFRNDFYGI